MDDKIAKKLGKTGLDRRQTVQSVEVGMSLLIALSRLGASVSLTHLAQAVNMAPSKAHRYMRALIDSGLAAQDEANGLYRLGHEALSIGFAAIGNLDVVAAADRPLAALRDRVNETCMLAVWANKGASVVRVEAASRAIVVNPRIGSVLPLLISASGLVFAAFVPDSDVRAMVDAERDDWVRQGRRDVVEQAELSIQAAQKWGVAAVKSTLTWGVSAVAAPVFDHHGRVAGAFAVMGATNFFDESLDGPIAQALLEATTETGLTLGFSKEADRHRSR